MYVYTCACVCVCSIRYRKYVVHTGWPKKNGTVDFSGLCSDQQLSFSPCWIEPRGGGGGGGHSNFFWMWVCRYQSCQPWATKKRNHNGKKKEFPTKKGNFKTRTFKPPKIFITLRNNLSTRLRQKKKSWKLKWQTCVECQCPCFNP